MHVIGTAGHVDHGKSSLVRALTGTDPDRWLEEQQRGMTLDLGFAHLRFDDGVEAGIVDVPGHERFLHNMLAGAAGMELVLLVIAANEGPKPQTLEHLAILAYLNVRRTIVVLTKSDTVDPADLPAIERELEGALRDTPAAGAPVVAVSTLTGDGLPELRAAIHAALAGLPERALNAPAYLPLDRVFALPGHGTIVTGTLMQGRIAVGDALALSPPGRTVRVRSVHVFGRKRERVAGGTRVALNLPGVATTELARGAVLAAPQFTPAASFAVEFRPLASAVEMLRRRTPVRAYIGAAEILGTLVFERAPVDGTPVPAVLHLRAPVVVVPQTPFVVRRVSPMDVLGGGTIASAHAVANGTPVTAAVGAPNSALLAALARAGLGGATPAQLGAAANLDETRVKAAVVELIADGRARQLTKPPGLVSGELADALAARVVERLRERQRERPWLLGMTSLGLAQALTVVEPQLIRVLATFVEGGNLVYRGGYYATTDFTPQLSAEQRAFFDGAFSAEPGAPPAPATYDELRARIRSSPIAELGQAFETLVASGALSKVGDFVYRGSHIAAIRTQLETALRRQGRLTVAEFRTLTGTSRKYAVPLLEFFDATGVTLRSGDYRTLRRTPATSQTPPPAINPP
jgi:selenocysteine-specific elongation factor